MNAPRRPDVDPRWWLALAGVVAAGVAYHKIPVPRRAHAAENGAITQTTVTGFVLDVGTGKAVAGAQVTTEPPTETVTTNAQGLYVIAAGRSFGTLTVRAEAPKYRQIKSTCIGLKAGLNTLGDVALLYEQDDIDDTCAAPCASGEECRLGQCVPACKPACACTETCQAGACVPREDLPTGEGICGANAVWLGGALCACKPGYAPSPDGRSCTTGWQGSQCPENSFLSDSGCECSQGYVPSPDAAACVPPEEAAVPRPLGDGKVIGTWTLPTGTPRGLASDGSSFFTIDLDSQEIVELSAPPGAAAAQVLSKSKVGDDAYRVMDLAADGTSVWMTRRGLVKPSTTGPSYRATSTLIRVDRATKQLNHIVPNNANDILGLALDGDLLTVESDQLRTRSPLNAQEVAPARNLGTLLPFDDDKLAGYVVTFRSAGTNRLYLAHTRKQLLLYAGTRYDGQSFVADFEVINAASPTKAIPLRILSVPIPGSHVLGLETEGARGWLIVGGAGLDQPVLAEVKFDDLF